MVATRKDFGATALGCTRSSLRRTRCDRHRLTPPSHATTTPTPRQPSKATTKIDQATAGSAWYWNLTTSRPRLITSSYTATGPVPAPGDEPVRTTIVSGVGGLVDRRTYPDSKWTEIAEQNGRRITLIILSDPSHAISKASRNESWTRSTAESADGLSRGPGSAPDVRGDSSRGESWAITCIQACLSADDHRLTATADAGAAPS